MRPWSGATAPSRPIRNSSRTPTSPSPGSRWPNLTGEHPRRGEIWLADMDKLRPAVIMHRDFAGRALSAVLVAPLTTTIRDIPTAVRLGVLDGIDRECVAALDNLTLLRKDLLVRRIGQLTDDRMAQLCAALAVAVAAPTA
ncbi:MAG: type II toxin-antitoxin system PemK/MazF family toxin [Sporichthyaceae bacterium]